MASNPPPKKFTFAKALKALAKKRAALAKKDAKAEKAREADEAKKTTEKKAPKKAAKKKTTKKKVTKRKASPKKVSVKKPAAKKAAAKKVTAKKAAPKKVTKKKATKSATKKSTTKRAPAKAKKKSGGKKSGGKKSSKKGSSTSSAKADDPKPKPAPQVGNKAPDFALPDQSGETIKLSKLKGKVVVLYFYPRDNTPGCTVEARGFADLHADFQKEGAVVLGVSRDTEASHARFGKKLGLPFSLLSDPSGEMIAAYGSWGEKQFMGRRFMGILRTTVVIDKKGKVRKVYPKVSVKTHPQAVLADLREMK